ncbi:glycosyltransferase family 4 protein [Patescibacteria group bacterium]|nr:glycosyltransferase family 4 protein [Patescibacteria group bacterium]
MSNKLTSNGVRKLRIAQIAPMWVSVPPEKYGGTELVIASLVEELVRRGHDITLFASGDSKTSAKLVSIYPRALLKDGIPWKDVSYDIFNVAQAFKRAGEFDIIHSHIDLYDQFFIPFIKTPVVSTMHNNMYASRKTAGRIFVYRHYRRHNFVSISLKQRENDMVKLNFVANVYNGINPEKYKFNSNPENKFIWIARIDKVKGVYNAILAAEKLGARLDIAGRIDEAVLDFFKSRIKPRLNKKIRYIGEINQKQKPEFFGNAKALLYPIEWEEPFGLVMIEALACGTPVIAFDRGAVSEIVEDGKTGFVVPPFYKSGRVNIKGLAQAMEKAGQIDRRICRESFDKNFTAARMADDYEKVYEKILRNH